MQSALKKNPHDTNIDLVFLLYWGVLVLWQNVNPGSTGTLADTLLKTALVVMLVGYYLIHTTSFSAFSFVLVAIFGVNMAIAFLFDGNFSLRIILTYFFPVLFAFFSCCTGGRFYITKGKLLRFMRAVILVVLYMAIYAFINETEKFLGAFNISNAYGNELSSFFISSHEYGMYLMAGIVACFVCFELDKKRGKGKNLFYGASLTFFFINIVLTYSRTAMLATAFFVVACLILNRRSRIVKIITFFVLVVIFMVLAIPLLRQYVVEIVFKGNNLAGRDDLAAAALNIFKGGSVGEKLWGQGATSAQFLLRDEAGNASAHNAYLETILCFGLLGLFAMLLFMISQLFASVEILKKNLFIGVFSIGLILACASTMFTNTAILFSSPIDSFFLTMFAVLVPRYVRNAVFAGIFDEG